MHENYDLDLLLELVEQRKFRSYLPGTTGYFTFVAPE